ncbi:MAG: DUF1592 domain-containing protein [Pseudomonadota bacterium]
MKNLLKISMLCLVAMATGKAAAQGACSVAYTTVNNWGSGGQFKVALTNTSAAKTSWELCWTYTGNDVITNLWDGIKTQTGKNVCVKNASHNGNLPSNGTASFGFLVNNPGPAPTAYTLNGVACGGTPTSSLSSTPTSVASSTPRSSSASSVPLTTARWLLDSTASNFYFVTVKKNTAGVETAENQTFTQLQGTVSTSGQATLTIPLASISTGVDLRNTRLQSMLFESNYLPSLHFTTQLDLAAINAMAAGSMSTVAVTGNLVLHGVVKAITFDAMVFKHSANSVSFSTRRPILINSTDFEMNAGVEALRAVMGLTAIGEKVPVYFKMFLTSNNPSNLPAITLPAAPNAPVSLAGSVSNATGDATLNWSDVSANESGFLVRRKGIDGRWVTEGNVLANTSTFVDSLLGLAGSHDYKVISYVNSVPSLPSTAVTVIYNDGRSSVSSSVASSTVSVASSRTSSSAVPLNGQQIFAAQCAGCHQLNTSFPTQRNQALLSSYIQANMPLGNVGSCGTDCANAVSTYLLSRFTNSSSSVASSVRSSTTSIASSRSSGVASSQGVFVGDASRGLALYSQRNCVSCHGVDGEKTATGAPALNPLNANRLTYLHSQDTQARSLRDFIARWMPQGNAGSCVGQCAADLEAYIWTWRKPIDGIPDNPISAFSCPSSSSYGQRTLRLLTREEYQRSVRDLVNYQTEVISRLPDDFIAGSFLNNNRLVIDKSRYTSYLVTAERIALDVATRWNAVLACTPSTSSTTCADKLVNDLAPRIFRRPLTATEKTAYTDVARGTTGSRTQAEGMEIALAAMLSSPQFLYRSEVGDVSGAVYKLNGYEMATYMSYTFTGSTPNATLMTAAANGTLNTVAGIRQQAAALLNLPNSKVLLGDLVNRWLATDNLQAQTKAAVANFGTLGADMKNELGKNFSAAMLDSSSTFASIYNPNYTHVNQRLASHYGLSYTSSGADVDGFVRVTTSDRGGILTSGAFLSRYATTTDANMVTRAVAVRRKMMCQDIPEPPPGVSLDREALAARDKAFFEDPKTTQRMIFDRITAGSSCANCHGEIINPLGGGLENYDTAGRLRSVDLKGNPIVSTGTFFSPYPQLQFMNDPDRVIYSPAIQFNGAKDLARTMVEQPLVSSQAQTCLATQFMSYSSGIHSIFLIDSIRDVGYARISKPEENAYRCDIADLTNVLTTRGPRAMLEEIPALESVMYRQVWQR